MLRATRNRARFLNLRLAAFASTASAQPGDLAYPSHPRPTPHEIFHLPLNASPDEVKARYYELVRLHHPDSPHCRHDPDELKQERFTAIAKAYESLRRRRDPLLSEEIRRRGRRANEYGDLTRRSAYAYHPPRYSGEVEVSNGGIFGIVTILAVVGSMALLFSPVSPSGLSNKRQISARQALAEAREEGRAYGAKRRAEIRKWVEEAGLEGAGADIGKGPRRVEGPRDKPV